MNSDSEGSHRSDGWGFDGSDSDEDLEAEFEANLQLIRENDPRMTRLTVDAQINSDYIQNMTNEGWEQLGSDIANNTHLQYLCFIDGERALNDHKMSLLFQGLRGSTSIKRMILQGIYQLSVAGIQSMIPFLQSANNLTNLHLSDNNIRSEGFNLLFRELRDSPIERLHCSSCCIETPEIDIEHSPRHLKSFGLQVNNISADGCRVVTKLLQGGDATLEHLYLGHNKIDDEGVEILVNALQNNTALKTLDLRGNNEISNLGGIMLLKLVNDISSIEATMRSNHTLEDLNLLDDEEEDPQDPRVQHIEEYIEMATQINLDTGMDRLPDAAAGRCKMILMQLKSVNRSELAEMQGVDHSLYSEINPLHLPEVLAMVGYHHGQSELYAALKSSIAGVISTVNRKECLKQQIAEKRAKIVEFQAEIETAEAELAAIEEAEVHESDTGSEPRSNKRHRVS